MAAKVQPQAKAKLAKAKPKGERPPISISDAKVRAATGKGWFAVLNTPVIPGEREARGKGLWCLLRSDL